MKPQLKPSGISMAVAAAALVAGCSTNGDSRTTASTSSATTDLVHCYNVNVCKGHNDCKTAENACADKASCKGTGFVAMPSKSCKDIGGSIEDKWVGQVNVADLVHCNGVNVCKGHNDCKTAENACAGKASCKGTGFVLTPPEACSDIGGSST